MRRLQPLDRALLLLTVPLWATCFLLCALAVERGIALSPLYVTAPATPDDYPAVDGFRPWLRDARPELAVGDRLLALGDRDLRGVGPIAFWIRVAEVAGPAHRVRVGFERSDRSRGETELALGSHRVFLPYLPASLAFAVCGVLMLVTARPSPTVRVLFLTSMVMAVAMASSFAGSPLVTGTSIAVHLASLGLLVPLAVHGLSLFPAGSVPDDRRVRRVSWGFAALAVFEAGWVYGVGVPRGVAGAGFFLLATLAFVTCLGVLTRNYRRAGRVGRRQLRWLLYGLYIALAPPLAAAAWSAIDPAATPLYVASFAATALFPVFLFLAVARYNLLDVDRLITTTASLSVLLLLGVPAAVMATPRAAELAGRVFGSGATGSRAVVLAVLAAAAVPLHRRLRPQIESLLFAERHALDRGVEALIEELTGAESPRELTLLAGDRVDRLYQPETCVVYGGGDTYVPVFVQGRAVPPAFEAASPLIAALRRRTGPLVLGDDGRPPDAPPLGPFDRAALETLDAALVAPVRRGDALLAFLCLGPRRNGDVYTSRDVDLLATVAGSLSSELLRFDARQIARDGRALQAEYERYVPGAIVAQLARGEVPEPAEREVSVLFVDLRGYTSFAEPRRAAEIFSTVNRYTELVSHVVQRHGGSVVEFNGDGMMAVFGAPDALPAKERAAVEAAREILRDVRGLAVDAVAPGLGESLSVAVGVATGDAYVGNIRAVDRMIWSAIGNTTNLAARLQGLARDLDADVVIDAATWRRAGEAAGDFEARGDVAIRGRRAPAEVFTLAPPPPAAAPRA